MEKIHLTNMWSALILPASSLTRWPCLPGECGIQYSDRRENLVFRISNLKSRNGMLNPNPETGANFIEDAGARSRIGADKRRP